LVKGFGVGVVARNTCAGLHIVPNCVLDELENLEFVLLHVVQIFQVADKRIDWGGVSDHEKGEGRKGPAFFPYEHISRYLHDVCDKKNEGRGGALTGVMGGPTIG
jgi:hypothetical protein